MASGRIDESQNSSDKEQEVFAGFTIEEIGDIRQARQTGQEQNLLRDVDSEIEDFFDLRPQERGSNSDVELYASREEESAPEESAPEENPPNALQWSSTLREINVRQFSVRHGPTRDLGDNATAKDFFSLFLDDAYSCILTKSTGLRLCTLVRKGIARSQQLERKFQCISG